MKHLTKTVHTEITHYIFEIILQASPGIIIFAPFFRNCAIQLRQILIKNIFNRICTPRSSLEKGIFSKETPEKKERGRVCRWMFLWVQKSGQAIT